tara:strand:+ start:102 stop:737 length:636 start_codon:yes stop_codon:yes gene_type:complete
MPNWKKVVTSGSSAVLANVTASAGFQGPGNFFVKSDGKVGINNNDPTYKLDVAGNAGINEYLYHNGDTNTYVRFQTDQTNIAAGGNELVVKSTGIEATTYISGSALVSKQTAASMTGANNVDLSTSANHNITITGNITLTPTNFSGRRGQSGIITLIQDSSGGHSITLNSLFKTPRGDSIAFDTSADGISLMSYYVIDASNVAVNYLGPFS